MVALTLLSFVICVIYGAVANVVPVGKCSLEDSNCLRKEFQNGVPTFFDGIPEANIDVLDVMDMDDVKFDLSGLQFTLKEGKLKGLKGMVIKSVDWNTKKNKISINFVANCTVKGHYTAAGRVLILPISGDGQMKLKLRDIDVRLYIDYDLKKTADGKERVAPKKLHFDFEVMGNAHFTLTNLFNGNKELSEAMHAFLNDNWKQVSAEFGQPMLAVAAKKIYKNVEKYFEQNPIADITL
ncbi:circadian clock-controlled protein daywake [Amyelois transitella]|uniref:circadian clock-controlled protein daywake n=1 Tax=Amyelois transitella TaxID=680683 RepID=UPI00067C029A|nr:circadian clock-controlled protein daywake [Amyelois transitella]